MQGQEDKVFTDVLNDINQQIAQNYEEFSNLSAFMGDSDLSAPVTNITVKRISLSSEKKESALLDMPINNLGDSGESTANNLTRLDDSGFDTGHEQIIETLNRNFKTSEIQDKDKARAEKKESDELVRLNEDQLNAMKGIEGNTEEDLVGKAGNKDDGGGLGGLFGGLGGMFKGGGLKAAGMLLTRIGGPLAAVGAFLSFADGFSNASDIVGKEDVSMIERIGAGGAKLITDFVNLFTNIANFFLPENLQLGSLDPAEVYKKLSEVFTKIMDFGSIFFDWYEDIFLAPFREMIGRLASAWEGDSLTERVWNFTKQFINEIVMWPINLMKRLIDWWTSLELYSDIVDSFKDFGNWLWDTIVGIPGMLMDKLTEWVTGWADSLSEWAPMNIVKKIGSFLPWPLNSGDDEQEDVEAPDRSMFSPKKLINKLSDHLPWPFNRDSDDGESEEGDSGGWFSSARNAVSGVFGGKDDISAENLQPEPTGGSRAEAAALDNSERSLRRRQNRPGYEQASDQDLMQKNQSGNVNASTSNNTVVTNNNQNTVMTAPISGRNTRSYSRASQAQRGVI